MIAHTNLIKYYHKLVKNVVNRNFRSIDFDQSALRAQSLRGDCREIPT